MDLFSNLLPFSLSLSLALGGSFHFEFHSFLANLGKIVCECVRFRILTAAAKHKIECNYRLHTKISVEMDVLKNVSVATAKYDLVMRKRQSHDVTRCQYHQNDGNKNKCVQCTTTQKVFSPLNSQVKRDQKKKKNIVRRQSSWSKWQIGT